MEVGGLVILLTTVLTPVASTERPSSPRALPAVLTHKYDLKAIATSGNE